MALKRKDNPAGAGTPGPAFEDDKGAPAPQVQTAPAANSTTVDTTAPAANSPIVASVGRSLPAVAGGKFEDVFKKLDNALPTLDFGTLPRLIGAQGSLMVKSNGSPDLDLGDQIEVELLSFNEEFCISPGTDKEEDKKHVKYSRDGKTIDGTGENVNAYLEVLRTTHGLKDASVKRYVQLTGTLEDAAKKPVGAPMGDMVTVSLSPQSVKQWEGYRLQRSVAVSKGRAAEEGSQLIVVTAVKKSGNARNWTELHTSAAQPAAAKAA